MPYTDSKEHRDEMKRLTQKEWDKMSPSVKNSRKTINNKYGGRLLSHLNISERIEEDISDSSEERAPIGKLSDKSDNNSSSISQNEKDYIIANYISRIYHLEKKTSELKKRISDLEVKDKEFSEGKMKTSMEIDSLKKRTSELEIKNRESEEEKVNISNEIDLLRKKVDNLERDQKEKDERISSLETYSQKLRSNLMHIQQTFVDRIDCLDKKFDSTSKNTDVKINDMHDMMKSLYSTFSYMNPQTSAS